MKINCVEQLDHLYRDIKRSLGGGAAAAGGGDGSLHSLMASLDLDKYVLT